MSDVIVPKFQKMKFAGYACIIFAALLTLAVVFGLVKTENVQATQSLIGVWLTTGVGLLTVNAGKRIGGAAVMNMAVAGE